MTDYEFVNPACVLAPRPASRPMPESPRFTGRRSRRPAARLYIASVITLSALAGCSATQAEEMQPAPMSSHASFPVPEGCPTGAQFTEEFASDTPFTELSPSLVSSQLEAPLLDGGCAYVFDGGRTNSDGDRISLITVAYFNLDTPDRPTSAGFTDWALSVGGTASGQFDYSLPSSYSGLTEAVAILSGGESSPSVFSGQAIPEYAQGTSGVVRLWVLKEEADALQSKAASASPDYNASTALADGLKLNWTGSFDVSDEDGYTATYSLSGLLSPFKSDVAGSKPGEFAATSSSTLRGTITNTTTQRNATITGVAIMALYPTDSAACTGFNGITKAGGDWQRPDFCYVGIGSAAGSELAPAQTSAVTPSAPSITSGPHKEGSDDLAQLNAPVAIYAIFGGERVMTNPKWTSPTGCTAPTMYTGGQTAVVMQGWPDVLCD